MDAKKMTAVEWLIQQISNSRYYYSLMEEIQSRSTIAEPNSILHKAKAMEKEQIELAFRDGWFDGNNPLIFKIENERYYNEKYKDESKTNI